MDIPVTLLLADGEPAPRRSLRGLAGRLAVPTIVIDERVFLGFGGHRDEIEALVRE